MSEENETKKLDEITENFNKQLEEIHNNYKKESKKIDKKFKISIAVTIFVCGTIALTSVLIPVSRATKVERALALQNVSASSEAIEEIEKKFGEDIPGKYVKTYINRNGNGSVTRIGDVFISEDGGSFPNTLQGSDVISIKNNQNITVTDYDMNVKIFSDQGEKIKTISYSDLEENYVLSFEENDDNSYSYKLVKVTNA